MERTESVVVAVSPDYENDKIKEMSVFGWNLQNRQEVIGHLREAEIPDSLAAAMFRGAVEGATGTTTVEYDHYVKLHFVRDASLPNLAKIRELEREYFALPVPVFPSVFPGCFFFAFPIWPLYLLFVYRKKKAAAQAQLAATMTRAEAIRTEAAKLIS